MNTSEPKGGHPNPLDCKKPFCKICWKNVTGIDHTTSEPISNIDDLIDRRVLEAKNSTKSDDEVVHIAWLARGIDLWHKSGGKMGHPPEKAERYIISSVTRLITEARKDQIMQDFNQVSLDTTIDEAILNTIRDNQLAELEATLKENK